MPHKKGKGKTIPKHKKNGVKLIKNHKIIVDANKTNTKYPFQIQPRKTVVIPTVQNKKQQIKQKRRLPVEVMPHVIDTFYNTTNSTNTSESPEENRVMRTDSNDKSDIKVVNLTHAKKIREQVWIHHNDKKFETKCYVVWCTNIVDVFNFQVGHDTPKALGGSNTLLNLKPICQNCNQSMGSRYSITEWNKLFTEQRRQMSTMMNRQNIENIMSPIEYEKIDLTSNILAMQQPLNILTELPVITIPQITQVTKMQPRNTQHVNMYYGPLAQFMPLRANRTVIIQSALSAMVIVGAWFFGA
jgi:5-methylcytosine-specific restriction endonuclease McrA